MKIQHSPLVMVLTVLLLFTLLLHSASHIQRYNQNTISLIQANSNPLEGWDKELLKEANTASSATYMTQDERNVVFYTNLCRLSPKKFKETVLEEYINRNKIISSEALKTLIETLNRDTKLHPLFPDKSLYDAASSFAAKMGTEGKTGHIDFQNRMKDILTKYNRVGENCSYGDSNALDCFIRLLIDKADPVGLQHRKNLLDSGFTIAGVSKRPHKIYKWNYVIDFAGND